MIELLNIKPGEILSSSIAYLFGSCTSSDINIHVKDQSEKLSLWPIVNGYFKIFVRLNFGKNTINIKTECCELIFTIYRDGYLKEDEKDLKMVRVLYVVCEDDPNNGKFQSPDLAKNKLSNALDIISLNVELIQVFISEMIYIKYNKKKTFVLSSDVIKDLNELNDFKSAEVFYTKLKHQDAQRMTSNEIFVYLANEIKSKNIFNTKHKYLAILSFTRYMTDSPEITQDVDMFERVKGYCALGAEWLACFGTPCLYTWAENLNDLTNRFIDQALVDTKEFMNDSAFRNTNWGCYSTTLGSLLHEFSHILDIGHNLNGIMARGFDDLYKFFTINFKECLCYKDLSLIKLNNPLIENVATFTKKVDNSYNDIKETHIRKIATFKPNLNTKELRFLSLHFNENTEINNEKTNNKNAYVIFNLIYRTLKQSFLTKSLKANISLTIKARQHDTCICGCNGLCFYEDSNLEILSYHKWLNNKSFNDISLAKCNTQHQHLQTNHSLRELEAAERYEHNLFKLNLLSKTTLEIATANKLVYYEIRTLRKAFTIEFGKDLDKLKDVNYHQPISCCQLLRSDLNKIETSSSSISERNKFEFHYKVNVNLERIREEIINHANNIQNISSTDLISRNDTKNDNKGFEFLFLDDKGNIFKSIFKLNI